MLATNPVEFFGLTLHEMINYATKSLQNQVLIPF